MYPGYGFNNAGGAPNFNTGGNPQQQPGMQPGQQQMMYNQQQQFAGMAPQAFTHGGANPQVMAGNPAGMMQNTGMPQMGGNGQSKWYRSRCDYARRPCLSLITLSSSGGSGGSSSSNSSADLLQVGELHVF